MISICKASSNNIKEKNCYSFKVDSGVTTKMSTTISRALFSCKLIDDNTKYVFIFPGFDQPAEFHIGTLLFFFFDILYSGQNKSVFNLRYFAFERVYF